MSGNMIADIVYYIILYSALALLAVPVMFFLFWNFLWFFKKHMTLFYLMTAALFLVFIAYFYWTRLEWILWYQAFPSYIQVAGLLIFCLSLIVIRLADRHLGFRTRIFWPVLKGDKFEIVTGGLYKIVRHPIYAMIPFLILGALMYSGEFILVFPLLFNLMTRKWYAKKEEAYAAEFAGGDYAGYMKKTPHRFYPKFF